MFPIKDDHIVIPSGDKGEYDVPIARCSDYQEIFAWVIHLLDKTWDTGEIARESIKTALHANGLSRPQV